MKDIYTDHYFSTHPGIQNEFDQSYYNYSDKQLDKVYGNFLPKQINDAIDIGCGLGAMLHYLINKYDCKNVIGIDISNEAIEYCKKNITNKVYNIDIEGLVSSHEAMYDLVFMNDVLEHFDKDDGLKYLKLIKKNIVRKGGMLVVTVPNMGNPFAQNDMWHDFTHLSGYNSNSLEQVLKLAGFDDINVISNSGHQHVIKSFPQKILRTVLAKLFAMSFGMRTTDIYYGSKIVGFAHA